MSVLSSTFLLTLLLAIGLLFFIKASVKDRIQSIKLVSEQPEASFLMQLQQYFADRAYRIASVDAADHQVVFEGFVRPSIALAVFLSVLAAIGLLCLVLMLSILLPDFSQALLGMLLLSPLAGFFYWRGAARLEQVLLKVETIVDGQEAQTAVTVTAHRDELAQLQQALKTQLTS